MDYKRLCGGISAGLIALIAATMVSAAVKLPGVIGDNMVLQRGQSLPIWGWAGPGDKITVSIAGQEVSAKAGPDGRWSVALAKLDAQPGNAPLEMTIQSSSGDVRKLRNILVGEVWVCSGQSNMAMGVSMVQKAQEEIAAAKYPQIRLLTVPMRMAPAPVADISAAWSECSPKTIASGGFSATAYFFGRALHKELSVPVGLIHTSWGGTPAEFWTSRDALAAVPELKPLCGVANSSTLYNGMIAPLAPFGIRGAIWYQGESNVPAGKQYRVLLPTMIRNWRTAWKQGDFPFGIVQIAPFAYTGIGWKVNPEACAELWEAQLLTAKRTPNAGLVVTTDIGDVKDIHPKNKQEVGRRLALWALGAVYGRNVVYSGPIYRSMTVEGDKVRLAFDHVGGGLVSRDGKPLTNFTVAGGDKKFHPATAAIDGDSVVVQSKDVAKPEAVRFAWREDAEPNFVNKAGLPASPFGTDQEK